MKFKIKTSRTLIGSVVVAVFAAIAPAASADSLTDALKEKVAAIVVIYAENRSFDSLFGTFPGAHGLSEVTDGNGHPTSAYIPQKDRDGSSELRLIALGPDKLKIEFPIDSMIGGPYATNGRDLPNPGDAVGEAKIEGNVASYVTGDTKKCTITLTFLTNRLEVTKEGSGADCGFRHHVVVATGTYRRIKGGHVRIVNLL